MNYTKSLGFLLMLFTAVGFGQERQLLSLQDAVNYALVNQADAKKAELKIENSKYQIQEARAAALPNISGSGSLMYMPMQIEVAIPSDAFPGGEQNPDPYTTMEFGSKWSSSVGVIGMQTLFNQQVFTGLKAAKTTREFYKINAELTHEEIIERVATAYYNVFVQKEQLETLDSSYQNIEKSKEVIQNLYDNGIAKEIDLDRVNVQLQNTASARQQLINAVQLQENALKFYIGMPIQQPIELVKEDFEVDEYLLADEVDTDERKEIQVLHKQRELLELQKQAKQAARYPSLSLIGMYNYMGQGNRFPIGNGLDKGVFWSDFSIVGLSLQIPIFEGFGNKAKVSQADIEIRILDEDIKNTELAMDLEYGNAKAQIENNLISIRNQQKNVALAEKVVRNTESNYKLGLTSLSDLLEAQNALVEAKNNFSEAVLQYKLAEVQLLKATGDLHSIK